MRKLAILGSVAFGFGLLHKNLEDKHKLSVQSLLKEGTTATFVMAENVKQFLKLDEHKNPNKIITLHVTDDFEIPKPELVSQRQQGEILQEIPLPNRSPVQLILRSHKSEYVDRFVTCGPLEKTWNKSAVYELNASKFRNLVEKPKKTVMVLFYMANCPQCKKMLNAYDQLGEEYKDDKNVIISRIELNDNIIENPQSIKLPMIKLFPSKNYGGGYKYAGEKSTEGMKKFIESRGQVTRLTEKMISKLRRKIVEKDGGLGKVSGEQYTPTVTQFRGGVDTELVDKGGKRPINLSASTYPGRYASYLDDDEED